MAHFWTDWFVPHLFLLALGRCNPHFFIQRRPNQKSAQDMCSWKKKKGHVTVRGNPKNCTTSCYCFSGHWNLPISPSVGLYVMKNRSSVGPRGSMGQSLPPWSQQMFQLMLVVSVRLGHHVFQVFLSLQLTVVPDPYEPKKLGDLSPLTVFQLNYLDRED